ncbi:uncharacterized protein LOC123538550 [Mercenaria mercenaria]|uniref:uncharacterized protein LOC123538550 n=1 Tax=Mercenaria mercenaria TaxID=6596 RepID=UPI00234EF3D5|nr:uncharacterized protein LOC123538550 [Mercenaria mercenaria]XP_045178667.2 uncharacterized protein LOC123538550 [Mercenaria mercenaria]XP_045178668.2 uncharacterized protein LOC123538550 [Mercenaria mercenaria]XP_053386385.1 uncharacterized protein LOC123538550 [Mercenaria mercenaria]
MMATLHSGGKKNNLELYLTDVYEKECEFKIEQEEVEFIQTGIETLVQDLVDKILAYDSFDKLISTVIDETADALVDMHCKKSLVEVYFPIQRDSSLQSYEAGNESYLKYVKSTIIKVGSFYDGTKNQFPDEFDFIFLLIGVRTPWPFEHLIDVPVYKIASRNEKSLQYIYSSEKHQATRKIEFEKYLEERGPAYKLRFIYSNGSGDQRYIHVDLVPAYKIIDCNTQQWFVKNVKENVEPKSFREEILSAGNCLFINGTLAFTEIEKHFMKNVISKKHVKVYRILKYLLNGHSDGEKLEEDYRHELTEYQIYGRIDSPSTSYTSYRIKILMIYHHETCTNTDTEGLGPCVLQVLGQMSKYETVREYPKFTITMPNPTKEFSHVLQILNSTITALQSMQTSENSYDYERDKIPSVSGQYLNLRMLGKHLMQMRSAVNDCDEQAANSLR